jgi:hypothetical protein
VDRFSFDDRVLGFLLGLGDVQDREICHGFPNACMCSQCRWRDENPPADEAVAQPWVPRPARVAA